MPSGIRCSAAAGRQARLDNHAFDSRRPDIVTTIRVCFAGGDSMRRPSWLLGRPGHSSATQNT